MTRKIIQISTIGPGLGYLPAAVALADDGTVWLSGFDPQKEDFSLWKKLPALPATDEEAVRLLENERAQKVQPNLSVWGRLAKFIGLSVKIETLDKPPKA